MKKGGWAENTRKRTRTTSLPLFSRREINAPTPGAESGMPSSNLRLSSTSSSSRIQDTKGRREIGPCKGARPLSSTHPISSLRSAIQWAADSLTGPGHPPAQQYLKQCNKRQPHHAKARTYINAKHWFAPMQSCSVDLKTCTTWPWGYNLKMQTIEVHRQEPCFVLCPSPHPTVTNQKMVTDGKDMAGTSCLCLVSLLGIHFLHSAFMAHVMYHCFSWCVANWSLSLGSEVFCSVLPLSSCAWWLLVPLLV